MDNILTCQPAFEGEAQAELQRHIQGAGVIRRLEPGVLLMDAPLEFSSLSQIILQTPIVFIRHIFPVEYRWPQEQSPADTANVLAERLDIEKTYSIQARSVDDDPPTRPISEALQAMGYRLDVRTPQQIISLYCTPSFTYAGISSPQCNLSGWNGGMMHFRAEGAISRAEFKLLEALRTFPISTQEMISALDLGAAPGGWSRVLADQYDMAVDAVDPADLDSRLTHHSNIRHHQMTAAAFQREYPDAEFDLIVNDMKMDARLSLDIMLSFRPQLRNGGWMLATIKLPKDKPGEAAAQAIRRLKAQTETLYARQLFHNRSEFTVCFQ